MKNRKSVNLGISASLCALLFFGSSPEIHPQDQKTHYQQSSGSSVAHQAPVKMKWLGGGMLNNWFASIGTEREEEMKPLQQQNGMQWPAIYDYQDAQCSRLLWMGAKDFRDADGTLRPYNVVTDGPSPSPQDLEEIFPVRFYLKSKYPQPEISVNGNVADNLNSVDSIDASMPWDREIFNEFNTKLGLTVRRRIFQFSQQYHDDYIISEYTFTNTGNTDGDTDIELNSSTLNDLRIFMGYRFAINRQTRVEIGNSSGWGVNTTMDTRGDGLHTDPKGEDFRAQFAWHGKYMKSVFEKGYDNIAAPVFRPAGTYGDLVTASDTTGRFAAPQFIGVATLYADKSASEKIDDAAQPSMTDTYSSDGIVRSSADTSASFMENAYSFISGGHGKRHLEKIGEQVFPYPAKFEKNPAAGSVNEGGYSFGNGYGPYTLKHGESIRIVIAEAAAGLSREKAIEFGRIYKNSIKSARSDADYDSANARKNRAFFTGKDSLFQTLRRARTNFASDWKIVSAPMPPKSFSIVSANDKVKLSWEPPVLGDIKGYEIYRMTEKWNEAFTRIAQLPSDAREYTDEALPSDVNIYYYISTLGNDIPADAQNGIASEPARSNPVYTRTAVPVRVTTGITDENATVSEFRLYENYPNPFNPSTMIRFSIPEAGKVSLRIFNILGKEVAVLMDEYRDRGEHSVQFNAQGMPSGIYFYQLNCSGMSSVRKMLLLK